MVTELVLSLVFETENPGLCHCFLSLSCRAIHVLPGQQRTILISVTLDLQYLLGVGLNLPTVLLGSLLLLLHSLHQADPLLLQSPHPGAQGQLLAGLLLQQFLRGRRW